MLAVFTRGFHAPAFVKLIATPMVETTKSASVNVLMNVTWSPVKLFVNKGVKLIVTGHALMMTANSIVTICALVTVMYAIKCVLITAVNMHRTMKTATTNAVKNTHLNIQVVMNRPATLGVR